jgi:anthranilate synthase component 1
MPHLPEFDEFAKLAQGVQLAPVYRRLTADTLTPVSAFQKIDGGDCGGLFESVVGGEKVGRYSFLTASPFMRLLAYGHRVIVEQDGKREEFEAADPLAELERRVQSFRAATLPGLPPFCGGAIGYAGYDTVRYVERLPNAPPDDRNLPDLAFAFFDQMVVFDNVNKTVTVIAMARLDRPGVTARAAYDEASRRVDELVAKLSQPDVGLAPADIASGKLPQPTYEANRTQADYEAAVERSQEYIRAGDIFQVVLSQRLRTKLGCPPFELYRSLRVVNPSPFMFYLRMPEVTLVGSSPEIMVRVVDGVVTNRPLAGTRPRGADEEEDRRLAEELLADPKERAEHIMLVDLGRNDVGRVAQYGTVKLTDIMTIERYSHVMHITSNVQGRLAPGKTAFDALRACLPAGTVSGAPKVRAMEIIDELEPTRRGPYAGAVGYIDYRGNLDTCIALRTVVVHDGYAYIQVGAGLVADSVPASEYQETINKAQGLLKAIAITQARVQGTTV